MRTLGGILAVAALLALVVPASADVLWDQSIQGDVNLYAGAIGLNSSDLREVSSKADDFILSGAATTVQKVTLYVWDPYLDGGVPLNRAPECAAVMFIENDTLAGGGGENDNRPKDGLSSTPDARPVGWTSDDWDDGVEWDTTRVGGSYEGGANTNWIYKAVVQTGGYGLTCTDTGYQAHQWGYDFTIWQLEIELPSDVVLEADTRYWLSFAVAAHSGMPSGGYYVVPVSDSPTLACGWEDSYRLWGTGYDYFFALEGVPEPATMALLGFGGIGLIIRRRK